MAVQKGKRRRRERRPRSGRIEEAGAAATEPVAESKREKTSPRPRRRGKSLAERSPLFTAAFTVACIGVTIWAFLQHSYVYAGLYLVLAAIQAFLTFLIYRARGSWR